MINMVEKIILILLCFFLYSCGYYTSTYEVGECNFRLDRGFVIKWDTLPIPVFVHKTFPSVARNNILHCVNIWNESWNHHTSAGRLFEVMGDTDGEVSQNVEGGFSSADKMNLIFFDRRYKILESALQGTTRIQNSFGGSIYDGDIVFNGIHFDYFYEDSDMNYSEYTGVPPLSTARFLASSRTPSFWTSWLLGFYSLLDALMFWKKDISRDISRLPSSKSIKKDEVDFLSLCMHEFGHLSGLVHNDKEKGNIMNSSLAKGQIRRVIDKMNLSSLSCSYL